MNYLLWLTEKDGKLGRKEMVFNAAWYSINEGMLTFHNEDGDPLMTVAKGKWSMVTAADKNWTAMTYMSAIIEEGEEGEE